MAHHGPILKDSEATSSGKVFRYLQGPPDNIKKQKMLPKSKKQKTLYFLAFSSKDMVGVTLG